MRTDDGTPSAWREILIPSAFYVENVLNSTSQEKLAFKVLAHSFIFWRAAAVV
jgi:hypothetical protein